ncbi:unnamed protein product [Bursaphelenchus okinawaensis]|uniref:Uncharacterized protein n=1 Tax=Bursaphelenchus okinawaensis TaxID=465554 RepID=A0A811KBN9_9BILA|nr:unnamed protein product [Bursaphelenchus okinawaensis]CAG9095601.1 unnamed protein product [Bursaphelenchus okinawaensis]
MNRRWTWKSPRGFKTMNDHFLVGKDVNVKNCETLNLPMSDHRAIRISTGNIKDKKISREKKKEEVDMDMVNIISEMDRPPDDYEGFRKWLKEVTQFSMVEKKNKVKRISQITRNLMEERRQTRDEWMAERCERRKMMEVCRKVRRSMEEDLRNHRIYVMEKAIESQKLRNGRRDIKGWSKRRTSLINKDGILVETANQAAKVAAKYMEKLYEEDHIGHICEEENELGLQ